MSRKCQCGAEIPPRVGRGRPRTYCETCSPTKAKNQGRTRGSVSPLLVEATARAAAGRLEAAVLAELERFDQVDSPDGAAALYAAHMLDAGGHTGSSAATLLREMRVAIEAAVKGVPVAGDVVDELKKKRRARHSA